MNKIDPLKSKDDMWHAATRCDYFFLQKRGRKMFFPEGKRFVIALLGKTGCGKGTIGVELSKRFKIAHISMGDLYRDAIQEGGDLAQVIHFQAERDISYTVDEVCVGMLLKRISEEDCSHGFILDGFPRTVQQSKILIASLLHSKDVFIPIELNATDQLVSERITRRFFCTSCKAQIRGHEIPEGAEDCPKCKNPLGKRLDDSSRELVEKKLEYYRRTAPEVRSELTRNASTITIDIQREDQPQHVYDAVCLQIDSRLDYVSKGSKNSHWKIATLAVGFLAAAYFLRLNHGKKLTA